MSRPLLARRVPFFGRFSIVVLCGVFFAIPFFMRAARIAVEDVRNKVSDWLPPDFEETKELDDFRKYFLGDQFVIISWDGCNRDNSAYTNLVRNLKRESVAYDGPLSDDEKRAHKMGDKLGWHSTGNFHKDFGSNNEKFFQGNKGQWYYITKQGKVYRWKGESALLNSIANWGTQMIWGEVELKGELIDQFGTPRDNQFYKEPRRLYARFFKDVKTGTDFLHQLGGPKGSLRLTVNNNPDSAGYKEVLVDAHKRLTGSFFGPTPSPGFDWSVESIKGMLSDDRLRMLPEKWEEELEQYVKDVVKKKYGGSEEKFINADLGKQFEDWFNFWDRLGVEMPPRQTCIVVTLNESIIDDFSFVVGRGLLGKPKGRILQLANQENGINTQNLHLGGPPVDNVSIDEEGSITLVRLASLSGLIGFTLSLLSFRSLRVTLMLFFVGGVAAISSLGLVWYFGSTLDAILMSMPSLIYVMALSGAIHVVNYYRDYCLHSGRRHAVSQAVRHAIFPCSLAAFTTALGLISLCTSNIKPINKFGFFSAIAVVLTVVLLFTYLPAALETFPPGFKKKKNLGKKRQSNIVEQFWLAVGRIVTRFHWAVNVIVIIGLIIVGMGIPKIQTSVQLLKLFHEDAKVIHDYHWMEENLGPLIPMEIMVRFRNGSVQPLEVSVEAGKPVDKTESEKTNVPTAQEAVIQEALIAPGIKEELQYDLRERIEVVRMIRSNLEEVFGRGGQQIVGTGMSVDVFLPETENQSEFLVEESLEQGFARFPSEFVSSPYQPNRGWFGDEDEVPSRDEFWRISLRLKAFQDVDYGRFVNEIKTVVEPTLTACRFRNQIMEELYATRQFGTDEPEFYNILFIGENPKRSSSLYSKKTESELLNDPTRGINQAKIFSSTLSKLLEHKNITIGRAGPKSTETQTWRRARDLQKIVFSKPERIKKYVSYFPVVVMIDGEGILDKTMLSQKFEAFIDASKEYHQFLIDPTTKDPKSGYKTAQQRMKEVEQSEAIDGKKIAKVDVSAIYTGVIPIVYKAQRTLLSSLIDSIVLAFVMIGVVMMILLRPWGEKPRWDNLVNFRGGMLSMLPNVFPIVVVFGAMGHLGFMVDIGSMMTASVAMGVAVDDTIHFLTWYRGGLGKGMSRYEAIMESYRRCGTAMTQTTLIAGLGLFAFAFSTFTPTQRFGTLMLVLLATALVGDLIFLPALLISPLGKFFGKPAEKKQEDLEEECSEEQQENSEAGAELA